MSDEFDMLDALRGDKVPPAGSKAKAEALDAAIVRPSVETTVTPA